MRLFLLLPSATKSDCSPADVSRWIIETVRWAYAETSDNQLRLNRVTAQEVRSLSTSRALLSGVHLDEIVKAGTWRSPNSFVSFYLRDMASELDGLHSLGPLSVSQAIV